MGWFVAPYRESTRVFIDAEGNDVEKGFRHPAIFFFMDQIRADGGKWSAAECLGNYCVAKVRASSTTLAAINADQGVLRIPKTHLDDRLDDLTQQQKLWIRDKLLELGYTLQEIMDRFGDDLGQYTLGDVLRFVLTRRFKPRFDRILRRFVFDGPIQHCTEVERVNEGAP